MNMVMSISGRVLPSTKSMSVSYTHLSGDLAVVDCAVDGVPFYAVLKLNYRPGFTHVTNVMRCV